MEPIESSLLVTILYSYRRVEESSMSLWYDSIKGVIMLLYILYIIVSVCYMFLDLYDKEEVLECVECMNS